MPELSEFVEFVVAKSGIRKPSLVEKDILIHGILREIVLSDLGDKYLFKGGSCLVKCYFGYYRFSVDLDFTWKDQEVWKNLGKKRLRRELLRETEAFATLLESIATNIGLDFRNDVRNKNYIEFGSGNRMVTFKLWKGSELIKIQVNFVERILFDHESVVARTLIDHVEISEEDKVYFEDFLNFYKPVKLLAYSKEEILCEKVRAMLTRQAQKLRDFYDIFMLEKHGIKTEKLREMIVEKIKDALRYEKYRINLERNLKGLSTKEFIDDPFEKEMFIITPPTEFYTFIEKFVELLKEIGEIVMVG